MADSIEVGAAVLVLVGLYLAPKLIERWGRARNRRKIGAAPQVRPEGTMLEKVGTALAASLRRSHPWIDWTDREFRGEWLIGVGDRWILWVTRKGDAVEVSCRSTEGERTVRPIVTIAWPEELKAHLAEIATAAAWWAGRLTIYRLERDCAYEVLRDFSDSHGQAFRAGARLIFVDRSFSPYDAMHALKFREASVVLREEHPAAEDFDLYFGAV